MSVYNTEILAHFNYLSITLIMIVYILVLFGLTIFIFLKSEQNKRPNHWLGRLLYYI